MSLEIATHVPGVLVLRIKSTLHPIQSLLANSESHASSMRVLDAGIRVMQLGL